MFPLICEAVIQKRLSNFVFPEDLDERQHVITKWLPLLNSDGQVINIHEFLHDIFVDCLGYLSPFNEDKWELELEPVSALGFFSTGEALPSILIDYSPIIDQEIDCNFYTKVTWTIELSTYVIRLVNNQQAGIFTAEFRWQELTDRMKFQKFYLLFCRRILLARFPDAKSPIQILWEESQETELIALKQIYQHLCNVREYLVKDFRHRLHHLPNAQELAIELTMKLLARMLFIAYAIGHPYLPPNLISDAYEFFNPYQPQSAWDNYKAIFQWLYAGGSRLREILPTYTCCLFAPDQLLDHTLNVGDEICRQLKEITRFNWSEISSSVLNCLLELLLQPTRKRLYKYPSKYLLSTSKITDKLSKISYSSAEELTKYIFLDRQCQTGTMLVAVFYYITRDATEPQSVAVTLLKHCLLGIDPNPIAITLTRLNLWLAGLTYTPPLAEIETHICNRLDEAVLTGKIIIEL